MIRLKEEKGRSSFIASARRDQMMDAAIQTLDEIGFIKASLSQIAKRAGISTALISYHFSSKEDLMNHVLMKLMADSTTAIVEQIEKVKGPKEKLDTFIKASLMYQAIHPSRNTALLEIVFNARTPENIPYYKMEDDEEEQLTNELQQILYDGQKEGVFAPFSVEVMTSVIQGAIGEFMLSNSRIAREVDVDTYIKELTTILHRTVLKDKDKGEALGGVNENG